MKKGTAPVMPEGRKAVTASQAMTRPAGVSESERKEIIHKIAHTIT